MVLPLQRKPPLDHLDVDQIRGDTQLARALKKPLAQFVRVFRNETADDTRPNKDLFELALPGDPQLRTATMRWNAIVREGVKPQWNAQRPTVQTQRPPNHQTINSREDRIRQHIAKGHRESRYLIVEAGMLGVWTDIFISPIGVVDKAGPPPDIRVINDYSYPSGAAVNDFTDRSNFPEINYNPPKDIALRIWELRARFPGHPLLMMIGDVSGAFRHTPVNADHVHMFAFQFDGDVIIDLSCGFGWCGSPTFYSVAGALINTLYKNQRPHTSLSPVDTRTFGGSVWCDDHTCVGIDTGSRCMEANIALRKAMATVLGPQALNEDKFTQWSTNTKTLGLLWDTEAGTVSVPDEKIGKARTRIDEIMAATTCSLSTVSKIIDSLRYVSTCFPAARSFYQNVQVFASIFRNQH